MEAHYKVHTIYSIGMVEEGSIVVKQNKHRTYIMSIYLSIYLFIYLSTYISIYLYIYISIYLYIYISIYTVYIYIQYIYVCLVAS